MAGTADRGRIEVLHVDDESAFAELVSAQLERIDERLHVRSAGAPAAALERIDEDPIECVVSDYRMPGMNGIEFLRAVREAYPNLPFVLFTGQGSEEVASEAIAEGVTVYLQKDGTETYEMLANRIDNAVSRQRSRHRANVAEDRLLTLYERTDGFFVLDREWTITYWNDRMVRRTGRSAESVLGKSFLEAFPHAEGTTLHGRYREAMSEDEARRFETYFEPHGYWVEIGVYPYDDGLFVHSREVSERVERARELECRNRALASFADDLAYGPGDGDGTEGADGEDSAAERTAALVAELLGVAREGEAPPATRSLRAWANRAWAGVPTEGAELRVSGAGALAGRTGQTERVFETLFANAAARGASSVTVERTDGGFVVADDGEGLPAEGAGGRKDGAEDGPYAAARHAAGEHGWSFSLAESSGRVRAELGGVGFDD
jgi:PAS domain S-box-containing protein